MEEGGKSMGKTQTVEESTKEEEREEEYVRVVRRGKKMVVVEGEGEGGVEEGDGEEEASEGLR